MSARLEQIRRLKEELESLEAAEKAESELPVEQRLATVLHSIFCHANHTDGCGWFYETEWDALRKWGKGSSHAHYLEWANRLIKLSTSSPENIIIMLEEVSISRYEKRLPSRK
jgi:hypothetical protein